MKKPVILLCIVLLCTAAANADEGVTNAPLFKLQSENTVVYILGSVHLDNGTLFPLGNAVMSAWEQCETLVVEAEVSDDAMEMTALVAPYMMMPDGKELADFVSEDELPQLQAGIEESGLPFALVKNWNPWLIDMSIYAIEIMKAGFTENGIDMFFLKTAREEQKEIIALETPEQQFDIFASVPLEEQIDSLKKTLAEKPDFAGQTAQLIAAYKAGDLDTLATLMNEDMDEDYSREFQQKVLTDRNKTWSVQIAGLIRTGDSYFAVVGAGHLAGKDSLIDFLKSDGYLFIRQ